MHRREPHGDDDGERRRRLRISPVHTQARYIWYQSLSRA
jgi:hypothetical protein